MNWDIFCRVIDNHGDLGVCWRLARQLARAGEAVRLWVDDARALAWMAPEGEPGVQLVHWNDADADAVRRAAAGALPDVVVEAFGCDPASALLERVAAAMASTDDVPRPVWINLEYLSAEPYAERQHGLPSPVFSGPGAGLTKWFFHPGFTPGTGGLLREPDLAPRQAAFDRRDWLARQGIAWGGEALVSLFCYEPPALAGLLAAWARGPAPTRLLVAAGRAGDAVRAALAATGAAGTSATHGALTLHFLPHLPQPEFDALLWACDLNLVRGEDSFVRAHWAGVPFVWQIYPQHDAAHHAKLDAWLDWFDAPASLRAFHHGWNGVSSAAPMPPDAATLVDWRRAAQAARARLLAQADLATQLMAFVRHKR